MTMTPMTTSSTERGLRSFPERAFDLRDVLAAKAASGLTVSVCLPARNEAATVGAVVEAIRTALVDDAPLVDEIVVIDDHSTDGTGALAAAAGATVVDAASVLAHHGEGHGKGEALWKSVHVSTGDLVVWVDADIVAFDPAFIVGMVGPLVCDPTIDFVKGHYHRPEADGVGGGRVTELLARPLLSLYFPELAEVAQPLAGEYAGRRTLLEQLPFVVGERIAQVDLGVRHHRNRTLDELGPQALAVGQAILDRAGVRPPETAVLHRPGREPLPVPMFERPPLSSL
jgi:glucosyl-3-phosphoglycerate synthase